MRHHPELEPLFEPVARYYRDRLATSRDVYGWGLLSGPPAPAALLLADPRATDVPKRIGNVDIVVKRVECPEAL